MNIANSILQDMPLCRPIGILYFTDDLIYELVCGLLDVKSNCYDELNSLASDNYQFTRDNLLTNEGRIHIKKMRSSIID